ncbi:2OG-Fe(II) oxygenase family protein [Phenylobacterium aquaticum]|uniref:2OG-Fe(II) oxygenase n=1 Tax=Phenylobacterium aquaticum TaxID=1763816 RepID=UPI0026EB2838|nr:2OG-Fe(II) oxygenase family protein [Phenylobacterium aquaticum]
MTARQYLNPDLDEAALAARFAQAGRLHVPDILAPDFAGEVAAAMAAAVPWTRAFTVKGQGYDIDLRAQAETPADVLAAVEASIAEGGRTGFQYDYERWRVSDEVEAGRRPSGDLTALGQVYDLLNSDVFLGLIARITGDARAVYSDAQATRYRAGHFLTTHDDDIAGKHRLFAYVLNLTPVWRPEWGGLLLFHDADGHVVEGFTPKFNALNLFRVPQAHSVSQTAGFVTGERLSVTGWIRSRTPGGRGAGRRKLIERGEERLRPLTPPSD